MEANVSTATVSRVLNDSGFVSDDIKDRVHLAVKKLNYQPNAIARSLKQDQNIHDWCCDSRYNKPVLHDNFKRRLKILYSKRAITLFFVVVTKILRRG